MWLLENLKSYVWLPLYFYWTEALQTTILNLTLKGTSNSTYQNLSVDSFPLFSYKSASYPGLSFLPAPQPDTWQSIPASFLSLIPSHPAQHQALLVLQDYYLQLTSHCPHSGQHHLPISIKAPPQVIFHMLACFFSARTLLFNHFLPLSNSTYPSTQL